MHRFCEVWRGRKVGSSAKAKGGEAPEGANPKLPTCLKKNVKCNQSDDIKGVHFVGETSEIGCRKSLLKKPREWPVSKSGEKTGQRPTTF